MATAAAVHKTNGKAKAKSFEELMAERRQRAERGLAGGEYRVEEAGRADGAWMWAVYGPRAAYAVTAHREGGRWRWECECKDFQRHADRPAWQCKHIHMVRLWHEQQKASGKAHKTNGRAKAARGKPAAASTPATDLGAMANFAVSVLETSPRGVEKDGDGWVVHIPHLEWDPHLKGEAGDVRVTRRNGEWVCSRCGVGECKHAVVVQVHQVWLARRLPAPLPAARAFLNARRNGKTATPASPPTEPPAEPPAVATSGRGDAELIRVLGDIVEQLQELNQNLRALQKELADMVVSLSGHLENIALTVEARGGG